MHHASTGLFDLGSKRPLPAFPLVVGVVTSLGAGKSDRLTDTTLMVIPRFVEELDV